jgi:hypothetical protein
MGRPPIGKVAMSGAERVRRYRLKHVTKPVTEQAGNGSQPPGPTVSDGWRKASIKWGEALGVPPSEIIDMLLERGSASFNRKFQHGLDNATEWWLIKMHSKYPDTFDYDAWEGSCGDLAIDKLYAKRGIPVGKYWEREAEWAAKEEVTAKRKAAWREKMKASGAGLKMQKDREAKKAIEWLEGLKAGRVRFINIEDPAEHAKAVQEAIREAEAAVTSTKRAADKAAAAWAAKKATGRGRSARETGCL